MLKERVLQAVNLDKMQCAFVIKNLKTGEEASYYEKEIVPSASLIKIPIAAAILRQVKDGRLSLKQRIAIRAEDKVPYSILTLLETGNDYSLKDLLTLMLIQSDNTAANRLIDIAGYEAVNRFCRDLGLTDTILQRKMMDSDARKAGRENLTTARDMAGLLELIYRGELIDNSSSELLRDILVDQLDNSMMRLYLPDDAAVAHKTGELEGLAHEAGLVFHETGDYIFTVLTWNAVSNSEARQTIGRISRIGYDYFTK